MGVRPCKTHVPAPFTWPGAFSHDCTEVVAQGQPGNDGEKKENKKKKKKEEEGKEERGKTRP
eukprot:5475173-Alexandrium_andersonii.AAC.1